MDYPTIKTAALGRGFIMGLVFFGFFIWGINFSLGPDYRTLRLMLYIPTYIALALYIILLTGAFNLSYHTDDKGLTINWGLMKKKIFWSQVDEIILVEGSVNFYSVLSGGWRGYMAGVYQVKKLGFVRMFGTKAEQGFLYIKTQAGFFGLTAAENQKLAEEISKHTDKKIKVWNIEKETTADIHYTQDKAYLLLYRLNILFMVLYFLFLIVFFPRSDGNSFIVLLLVLALALLLFNINNAKRLYQFSETGSYFLLVLSSVITLTLSFL
ncbi:MAG: PH domain-containing protein, partial [Syntrophomonadaceae bacterium]|nr:PH domain-containing protein [Syntrophomonadaceae bacterium]